MGALIWPMVRQFLPYLIGAIAVFALYAYWHHEVYTDGVMHERTKWESLYAEGKRQSTELRLQKDREVWEAKLEDRENYMRAFETYGKHIENLNSELAIHRADRLRIRAKRAACDSDAVPGKANNTAPDRGRRGEIYTAELEPETAATIRANAAEVAMGAAACAELLSAVKREFKVE